MPLRRLPGWVENNSVIARMADYLLAHWSQSSNIAAKDRTRLEGMIETYLRGARKKSPREIVALLRMPPSAPKLQVGLEQAAVAAILEEAALIEESMGVATGAFGMASPVAVTWAEQHALELAQYLTAKQEQTITGLLVRALDGSLQMNGERLAPLLVSSVGLTPTQASWVANREARLQAKGVSKAQIRSEIKAFSQSLREQRATTIARTEINRALLNARLLAWRKSQDNGLMTGSKKMWLTAPNCCDLCIPINNQQTELDGTFDTPWGHIESPADGHPNCRCTVVVVTGYVDIDVLAGIKSGPVNLYKGEREGHPFRGNQYTRGIQGAGSATGVVGARRDPESGWWRGPDELDITLVSDAQEVLQDVESRLLEAYDPRTDEEPPTPEERAQTLLDADVTTGIKSLDLLMPSVGQTYHESGSYDDASPMFKWRAASHAAAIMLKNQAAVASARDFVMTNYIEPIDPFDPRPGRIPTVSEVKDLFQKAAVIHTKSMQTMNRQDAEESLKAFATKVFGDDSPATIDQVCCYMFAAHMQNSWAGSAATIESNAMKLSVARHDAEHDEWLARVSTGRHTDTGIASERLYNEYQPAFDAYTDAVYSETQRIFSEASVNRIQAWRGIKAPTAELGGELYARFQRDLDEGDASSLATLPDNPLYQMVDMLVRQSDWGVPLDELTTREDSTSHLSATGMHGIQTDPLSSWSSTDWAADMFGDPNSPSGNDVEAKIHINYLPVDAVWSTSLTGPGCTGETEMILRESDNQQAEFTIGGKASGIALARDLLEIADVSREMQQRGLSPISGIIDPHTTKNGHLRIRLHQSGSQPDSFEQAANLSYEMFGHVPQTLLDAIDDEKHYDTPDTKRFLDDAVQSMQIIDDVVPVGKADKQPLYLDYPGLNGRDWPKRTVDIGAEPIAKGERAGHPFRGNQYTGGILGGTTGVVGAKNLTLSASGKKRDVNGPKKLKAMRLSIARENAAIVKRVPKFLRSKSLDGSVQTYSTYPPDEKKATIAKIAGAFSVAEQMVKSPQAVAAARKFVSEGRYSKGRAGQPILYVVNRLLSNGMEANPPKARSAAAPKKTIGGHKDLLELFSSDTSEQDLAACYLFAVSIQKSWAFGSDTPEAMAMKVAVDPSMENMDWHSKPAIATAKRVYKAYQPAFDSMRDAVYQRTQRALKKAGITTISEVYRGVAFYDSGRDSREQEVAKMLVQAGSWDNHDEARVYFDPSYDYVGEASIRVVADPLSSWAYKESAAHLFTGGDLNVTMSAYALPASDVWGLSEMGMGCLREHECILKNMSGHDADVMMMANSNIIRRYFHDRTRSVVKQAPQARVEVYVDFPGLSGADWPKRTDDVGVAGNLAKGEPDGHAFRGNQYTGGIPGGTRIVGRRSTSLSRWLSNQMPPAAERRAKYGSTVSEVVKSLKRMFPGALVEGFMDTKQAAKSGPRGYAGFSVNAMTAIASALDLMRQQYPAQARQVRILTGDLGGRAMQNDPDMMRDATAWTGIYNASTTRLGAEINFAGLQKFKNGTEESSRYAYATTIHEFGHVMHAYRVWTDQGNRPGKVLEITEDDPALRSALKADRKMHPDFYSATNTTELAAEEFLVDVLGPSGPVDRRESLTPHHRKVMDYLLGKRRRRISKSDSDVVTGVISHDVLGPNSYAWKYAKDGGQ